MNKKKCNFWPARFRVFRAYDITEKVAAYPKRREVMWYLPIPKDTKRLKGQGLSGLTGYIMGNLSRVMIISPNL